MAFVVAKSRNPTLQLAWAMHKAAQKAEGRAAKAEKKEPEPVKNAKPPAKKAEKKGKR